MSEKLVETPDQGVDKYSQSNNSEVSDNSGSTTKNSNPSEIDNINDISKPNEKSVMQKLSDEVDMIHDNPDNINDLNNNDNINDLNNNNNNQLISILEQSSPQHILPYKQKLSYRQNIDFTGNQSSEFGNNMTQYSILSDSAPGESLPNTFKNKTHPNARSKDLGASKIMNGTTPGIAVATRITEEETSTQLQNELSHNNVSNNNPGNFAGIYPPGLPDVKWPSEEFKSQISTPGKMGIQGPSPFTEYDLNTGNSVIHNSNILNMEVPKYRAAHLEYENQKNNDELAGIFQHVDQEEDQINKEQNSISTTVSTPYPTINKHPRDFPGPMETVREVIANGPNRDLSSPLKLYHNFYNTFTKNQLAEVIENVRSNKNTPAPPLTSEQSVLKRTSHSLSKPPVLNLNSTILNTPDARNIKDFTKTGAYNERSYLKNADKVFSDLKKKGYPGMTDGVRITSQATNTSTPKKGFDIDQQINFNNDQDQDDSSPFTSFSTGSTGMKSDTSEIRDAHTQGIDASSEDPQNYTSYSRESVLQTRLMIHQNEIPEPTEGSYTFDEESEDLGEDGDDDVHESFETEIIPVANPKKYFSPEQTKNYISPATRAHLNSAHIVQNRIPMFEHENSNPLEESRARKSPVLGSRASSNSVIWKSISQLQLNKGGNFKRKVTKGRVEPNIEIPYEINGNVFDPEKQVWRSKNESLNHTTFASIPDLIDDSHPTTSTNIDALVKPSNPQPLPQDQDQPQPQPQQSILKKNRSKRGTEPLEVSFHEPDTSSSSMRATPAAFGDVTRVSQIQEVSFSESNKRLVSVITETLDNESLSWKDIREIMLDHCNLNNVKGLNTLLPSLVKIDLSNNDIKYLTGLPRQVMQLDLSNNRIEGITPFSDYHDLTELNLDNNQLTVVTNLSQNIHLTSLSLHNNKISNLSGLGEFFNLRVLNLLENEIQGKVNFNDVNLPNLEMLDLSNNHIQHITGLSHLPKLKVLELDNNSLFKFESKSSSLVKLLMRFNIIRYLDVSNLPLLRCLKIDQNVISEVDGIKKLKALDEISCKSQESSETLVKILYGCENVKKLDLSGNRHFFNIIPKSKFMSNFPYVTHLTLSAMNLESIPNDLALKFPNVQNLNLSFNKLTDLSGLENFTKLKKIYLVDNLIDEHGIIMKGLRGSRNSLKVLDARLNPCTKDLYPYVFSSDEKEATNLDIVRGEDIQSFLVNYKELDHSGLWTNRDKSFLIDLINQDGNELLNARDIFECFIVVYFYKMVKLNGSLIEDIRRKVLFDLYQSM